MYKNRILLFLTFVLIIFLFSCELFTYLEDKKSTDNKNPIIDPIDPSFQTYEYIQFEDIPENILNIRQTAATKNSYTIEWDVYPGADEYKIYRNGDTYIESVTTTTYSKTGQRAGFWFYNPDDLIYGGTIKIYPVVSNDDVIIDYVFAPLLFDNDEIIKNNYTDDFNDNSISSIYNFSYKDNVYLYEYGNVNDNNQVYEINNILNLDTNTTDGYPRFHFLCTNYKNKNLSITAKIHSHLANNYNRTSIRKSDLIIGMDQFEGVDPDLYGLYCTDLIAGTEVELTSVRKFDEWIDFGIYINKESKKLTIHYDTDSYIVDYDDSYEKSSIILITFNIASWFTGNDYKIDDLTITYD